MGRKEENRLGLLGATAYIVGSIVGSGILVAPRGIIQYAGSVGLSLIIWALCAVLSMLTAINYVELGTSIPESGAELAYITYLGWHPIAFSFLWLSTVVQSSCSGAVLFLTFGEYMVEALNIVFKNKECTANITTKLFGFGLLFLLTVSNMYSLRKIAGKIQIVSMFSKIAVLTWIIGAGGYSMIFKGDIDNFKPKEAFAGSNWSASKIVLAIYQGNWAYGGFTTLNYGTEDVQIKNFRKTLPRAVLGGLAISSIIYILANIAYFSELTPADILGPDPIFMKKAIGQWAADVMPALVGLLIIGTLNSDVFTWSRYGAIQTRIIFRFMLAGARKGLMPTPFALVHPGNDSPRVAVLTHTILCVGFSFIGDMDSLVDYLTIVGIMCTCFALLALIIIKWKKIPVAKEAVKFHIFWPILNLVINIALLVIPFTQDWVKPVVGIALFLAGCIMYFIFVYPKRKPHFLYVIDDKVTKACQLLFWTIVDSGPEYQVELTQTVTEETKMKLPDFIERF